MHVLAFSDCHYSDARNTINETSTESSFRSGGIRLFETLMNTIKRKVREKLQVEQPVGSVLLAPAGTLRSLRTSQQNTNDNSSRHMFAGNCKFLNDLLLEETNL